MKRIEILGASGTGKSTLYSSLKKVEGRNYITIEEAEVVLAKRYANILLRFYFNQRFTDKFKVGLARKLINNKIKIINSFNEESRNLIGGAINEKFYWNSKKGIEYSINQTQRILTIIKKYYHFNHAIENGSVILIDEGLFHATSAAYVENFKNADILPHGVLYLYDNEDNIYGKILHRKQRGITASAHIGMTNSELKKFIAETIEMENNKIDKLIKCGVEVCFLDMSLPIHEVTNSALEFLNKYK